jgi:hypothetical protein
MPRSVVIALVTTLVAACAGMPRAPLTPEEIVTKRAVERWEHLIAGRTEEAWEYLSPGAHALLDRETYITGMKTRPVHWLAATVQEVSCEPEVCEVLVLVETETQMPFAGRVPGRTVLSERWLLSGDTWRYVPSRMR